jgi:hypothetical protein
MHKNNIFEIWETNKLTTKSINRIEHYTEIKDPETIARILRYDQSPDWVPVLGGQRGNLGKIPLSHLGEYLITTNPHIIYLKNTYIYNKIGQTLLHWAVFYGAVESVALLVAAGADIHKKDLKGKTPLDLAIQQKACKEIIELVSEKKKIVTKHTQIPE